MILLLAQNTVSILSTTERGFQSSTVVRGTSRGTTECQLSSTGTIGENP
jgi:hypothetical protein